MKKLKFLSVLLLTSIAAVCLAACAPFDGFDDDAVIVKARSQSTYKSVENSTGSQYSLKAEKFNGVKTIKNITVPENPKFDMTLNIEDGQFKVVLVKDDTVVKICDSSTEGPVAVTLAEGTYSLRIVGKDAKINFTFKYNAYK